MPSKSNHDKTEQRFKDTTDIHWNKKIKRVREISRNKETLQSL